MKTTGFSPNCSYIPFIQDGNCGYVVTREDTGEQSFLHFVPSMSGEDLPDVFVYRSPTPDPADGSPLCSVYAFDFDNA